MKSTRFFLVLLPSILLIHNTNLFAVQPEEVMDKIDLHKIQDELHHPEYRTQKLPHDFSNMINLIRYGTEMQQPRTYYLSVFKLFGNLLKGSEYTNAYAYEQLIDELISLEPYFTAKKERRYLRSATIYDASLYDRFKESVNNMLYVKFSSEYDTFKQDPEEFLHKISDDITEVAKEEISIEQLRNNVVRFLEIGLNKLIWSPEDQEKVWESVKSISHNLARLMEHGIIDDANELDDLYWSLTHRFCYFMDLTNTDLNRNFYDKVKEDLTTDQLLLTQLEEQNAGLIESRTECLKRTIIESEAHKIAYAKGMVI